MPTISTIKPAKLSPKVQAISLAALLGTLGLFMLACVNYPCVDDWEIYPRFGGGALLLAAVLVGISFRSLAPHFKTTGTPQGRRMLAFLLIGLLAIPSWALLDLVNGALDRAAPQPLQAPVLSLRLSYGKNTNSYYAVFTDPVRPDHRLEILYKNIRRIPDHPPVTSPSSVSANLHPGFLGVRWVDSVAFKVE